MGGTGRAVFRDPREVMSQGRYLKRWLVIAAIGQLPLGMVFAFSQVYAHEVKGADAVVLGGMATGAAAAAMDRELVPAAHMGRWIGIARVVKMLVSATLVLVAGYIWDRVGPEY